MDKEGKTTSNRVHLPGKRVLNDVVIVPAKEWEQIVWWLHHYSNTVYPKNAYHDEGRKLAKWCKRNEMKQYGKNCKK